MGCTELLCPLWTGAQLVHSRYIWPSGVFPKLELIDVDHGLTDMTAGRAVVGSLVGTSVGGWLGTPPPGLYIPGVHPHPAAGTVRGGLRAMPRAGEWTLPPWVRIPSYPDRGRVWLLVWNLHGRTYLVVYVASRTPHPWDIQYINQGQATKMVPRS